MPFHSGRDFLIKAGNAATPEVFSAIGAARAVSFKVNNALADNTPMGAQGVQAVLADAGGQSMTIAIEGLFRDAAAETVLRTMAMDRLVRNFELVFPNGDKIKAAFAVQEYARGGSMEGLETFSAVLVRSGASVFTAAGA